MTMMAINQRTMILLMMRTRLMMVLMIMAGIGIA